jgi:ProP effector
MSSMKPPAAGPAKDAGPGPNTVLDRLCQAFPVFKDAQPLAIGIHKSVRARLPDINAAELRTALQRHTASTRYLKALANSSQRFDLDGQPAGEVTQEQRDLAAQSLKDRFRKGAERAREAQAARERQEKLQKLAEKFSRPGR